MNVDQFSSEEDFETWFYDQTDPTTQIQSLHEWRKRQERIAPALRGMVRLLANEQYSQRDHFLLELLQNADDNSYAPGTTPTLSITLQEDRCIFECNEKGFTAENVFAICYAAASTKARDKSARTFIGEKGIGFKSIFAIAEAVEIHSGPYHFELRDREYVLPHLLEGDPVNGSRIVIRFKEGMDDLAASLSERLQDLAQDSQHFLLFLQKLEKLTISDRVADSETTVQVIRSKEEKRFLVQNGQETKAYHVEAFEIVVPADVVNSRFDDLKEELPREIIFAVPLPEDLPSEEERSSGKLFCFLPTEVSTGLPIHIQIDAKTVTNREDIADCDTSLWNAFLLIELRKKLGELFLRLRSFPDFLDHLPEYLPPDPAYIDLENADLEACLTGFCDDVREHALFRDCHGDFRPAGYVRQAPENLSEWIETAQYEGNLPPSEEIGDFSEESADVTFLHPNWRPFGEILESYGCERLRNTALRNVLIAGGVPEGIPKAEESEQRRFLEAVMKTGKSISGADLRDCPLFPVRSEKGNFWDAFGAETLLLVSETQNPNVPEGVSIVDPKFTYTPGGGRRAEEVRDFNNRFRGFLEDRLELERFTEVRYLEQVLVEGLVRDPSEEALSDDEFVSLSDKWIELYHRIWRRRTTIIDDSSQGRWDSVLQRIGECVVPVKVYTDEESYAYRELPLGESMLPELLGGLEGVDEAYPGVGAPMVAIDIENGTERYWQGQLRRREEVVDFNEWTQFLVGAGARQAASLRKVDWAQISDEDPSLGITDDFCERVESEIPESNERWFVIRSLSTTAFDPFTGLLLNQRPIPEVVTRGIGGLWQEMLSHETKVGCVWSNLRSSRWRYLDTCLGLYQMEALLQVVATDGELQPATECFLDTPENQHLSQGSLPLVDSERYGNNEAFLAGIGIKPEITYETVSELIESWHSSLAFENTIEGFTPYLEVLVRLGQKGSGERHWLRAHRIFYHSDRDELLDYDDWKQCGGPDSIPSLLRAEVEATFGSDENPSSSELIEDFESIGDIVGNASHLELWLRKVTGAFQRGEGDAVGEAFAEFIRDEGVLVGGERVHSLKSLPAIWDRNPLPFSSASSIFPPEDPAEGAIFVRAANELGWPLLSGTKVKVVTESTVELESKTLKHLELAYGELLIRFKADPALARLQNLPLAKNWKQLQDHLRVVENLTISTGDDEDSTFAVEVPYWRSKNIYYLQVESEEELPRKIARLIDEECSVTIAPFFEMVWEHTAVAVQEFDPSKEEPETFDGPPKTPGGGGGGGGGLEEGGVDDLLGGEKEIPSEDDPGENDEIVTQPTNDDLRKRLFSYVIPPGSGQSSKKTKTRNQQNQQKNEETEVAGAQKLAEFFEARGLTCESVESENVGYDFEVTVGERKLLIELKTSRAKWRNWEHSLSPNEFKVALEKADDYFLCVIDRVFEDSCEIYFIQNPAGKADGFLFDAPWKSMGMKMSDMITRIKAEEGILDD